MAAGECGAGGDRTFEVRVWPGPGIAVIGTGRGTARSLGSIPDVFFNGGALICGWSLPLTRSPEPCFLLARAAMSDSWGASCSCCYKISCARRDGPRLEQTQQRDGRRGVIMPLSPPPAGYRTTMRRYQQKHDRCRNLGGRDTKTIKWVNEEINLIHRSASSLPP